MAEINREHDQMRRSRKRLFSGLDEQDLLKALEECRHACSRAQSKADYGTPIYRACSAIMSVIDATAALITGDPEHFWTKAASVTSNVNQPDEG